MEKLFVTFSKKYLQKTALYVFSCNKTDINKYSIIYVITYTIFNIISDLYKSRYFH
jgi:hypothetical protein